MRNGGYGPSDDAGQSMYGELCCSDHDRTQPDDWLAKSSSTAQTPIA